MCSTIGSRLTKRRFLNNLTCVTLMSCSLMREPHPHVESLGFTPRVLGVWPSATHSQKRTPLSGPSEDRLA